jgi:glycosyltransferase involved in cell wall biosynthesis
MLNHQAASISRLAPAPSSAAPPIRPFEGTVVYLAPRFPGLHQTYVQREVRLLRQRGWKIQPVGLNASMDDHDPTVDDLRAGAWTLYEHGLARLLPQALAELAAHPVRGLATLARATVDTIAPGEPLGLRDRLKLVGQAMAGLALARRLRPLNTEWIHCHFAHSATTVGMYAARQLGIPFSFTGHANDLFQRRCLLRKKLQRAAFVGCISQWHRELYESIEPDPAGKYQIIRCGVDTTSWTPVNAPGRNPGDPLRILTVGRLVEKKGIDTLIEALPLLKERHGQEALLTVAGDGPSRSAWTARAEGLGCAHQITWLGDVKNDVVQQLLARSDVFALPCRPDSQGDRDGIPVVLMESMACAVPSISGDLPAVRELVIDEQTGLLVQASDPAGLASALYRLASDPDLSKKLGEAGRAHVLSEFASEVNIDRLEHALVSSRSA